MRRLLRYICGFLQIKIYGEYAEKLINKMMKNGVFLWDINFCQDAITAYIKIKDFRYLPVVRKNIGARVKIVKKTGLPFIVHRYRKRLGLVIGAIIFLAVLNFLSLFIWTVEVSGNTAVKTEDILLSCKKIGIYEGVKKSSIKSKNMADKVLLQMPDLAWCSVNVEGCLVTVNVTETKNIPDKDSKLPSNLIASEDGIIKWIDVVSGNTVVRVGDTVAKGDLLVSGISENISSTVFVRSQGVIKAEIKKTFKAKANFSVFEHKLTGKVKKQTVLSAFGIKIPLYFKKPKGDFLCEETLDRLVIKNKKLPFFTFSKTYRFTEKVRVNRSEEDVKEILKQNIEKQIKKYGDKDYIIEDEKYTYTNNGIELEQTAIIVCDIKKEKAISVTKE